MTRKQTKIKVIIHAPEDQLSLDSLQEATNQLFARIIENKLSVTYLTSVEKEHVIRQVIAGLDS